jgi:hypothetical protein
VVRTTPPSGSSDQSSLPTRYFVDDKAAKIAFANLHRKNDPDVYQHMYHLAYAERMPPYPQELIRAQTLKLRPITLPEVSSSDSDGSERQKTREEPSLRKLIDFASARPCRPYRTPERNSAPSSSKRYTTYTA